jgi:capsular polysaccharide biosynthesis protein
MVGMSIDEAVHRVVRRHWLLILLCVVIPVCGSVVWTGRQPVEYQAIARLQMGTDLAASNVQADATSQRALGIATSPGVVSRALAKAKMADDPRVFANDNITVTRVGVSPVLEIAVTAESSEAATTIAGSITNDVLQVTNQAYRAAADRAAADRKAIDARRRNLQKQIAGIEKQRASLIPRLVNASPGRVLAIQAQLAGLTTSQTEYQRELADLEQSAATPQQGSSSQQGLASQQTLLLDPARTPALPVPNGMIQQAAIAGLIGLLLGLGIASLREAVSPSLRSPRAVSDALGVPHLGHIPSSDLSAPESVAALAGIGDRLTLLARGQRVRRVFLQPVGDRYDVLADLIAIRLRPQAGDNTHRVDCVVLGSRWEEPGDRPAAVLLCRRRMRAGDLKRAMAQLEPLGWPLLGFITCETRQARAVGRHVTLTAVDPSHASSVLPGTEPDTAALPGRAGATPVPAPSAPRP